MLEALKNMTGGKGKQSSSRPTSSSCLLPRAREERSAISAMLTSFTTRSAKLTPLSKSLEQMTEKATTVDGAAR